MSPCKHTSCPVKRAVFGKPGTSLAEYCSVHKPAGYVNVKDKHCQHPDCTTIPNYGKPGSKQAEYCAEHKPAGYVDVKSKHCQHPDCTTQPVYGKPGSKQAEYCAEHKPAGYVDVKSKHCQHPDCTTIPAYGKPGSRQAEYCTEHKPAGYVNVKSKQCQHPDCTTIPIYGKPGSKTSEYCAEHKPAGYVDVKNKHCQHPDCTTQPVYGKPGSKQAEYCAEHKPAGYVDVKHKHCQHPDCTTRPNSNYPGYSPEWCATHRLPGMILHPIKKCGECKEKATRALNSSSSYYCEQHAPDESVEITNSCSVCCKSLNNPVIHTCDSCLETLASGKTVKRKLKELTVKSALENAGIKIDLYDARIPGGCSAKRPDFIINISHDTVIIVEVDEHQHRRKNYSCECEITRMKQIYFDWGVEHGKMLFLRYNPDEYSSSYGKDLSAQQRADYLIRYIRGVPSVDTPGIKVLYMFYDGFTILSEDTTIIDPYE